MPGVGGVAGKEAIGQLHGFVQDVSKDGPGDLLSGFSETASVDLLSIYPQSAAPGISEEIPGLDVHSLALPACHNGENEGDELWEGKFAVASKVFGRLSEIRINFFLG